MLRDNLLEPETYNAHDVIVTSVEDMVCVVVVVIEQAQFIYEQDGNSSNFDTCSCLYTHVESFESAAVVFGETADEGRTAIV